MSSALHTTLLAVFLFLVGLLVFFNKVFNYEYPVFPGDSRTVWNFEVLVEFVADNRPVRIEAFLPAQVEGRDIADEQFYSGPFGLRIRRNDITDNRTAVWTYRYPEGAKVLRYRTTLVEEGRDTPLPDIVRQPPQRGQSAFTTELEQQAFIVWLAELRRQSVDKVSFAELTLQSVFSSALSNEIEALIEPLPGALGRLELVRKVFVNQGISARIANGVILDDPRRRAETLSWLEYHIEGQDFRYFVSGTPSKFFAIWYGKDELVEAAGISELSTLISLQPARFSGSSILSTPAARDDFMVQAFNYDRLPLTTQLVYRVLLTIPIGILLLVVLRQFVGIQTLGTFMPVLIGIAFRETALLTGLLLFSSLIALGLMLRFYLERLKLLLVPRLAVVLVFIVLCMAFITGITADTDVKIGLSVSLFPMVIITMTIERMSIVWEEYSSVEAIKQGVGSLVVASLAYLVMSNNQVEYMMFNFPELLLVIMGFCLLIGRYMGLRLSEVWRFRDLIK